MKKLRIISALVAIALLGGCATYQKYNFMDEHGYTDEQVGTDTFMVRYRGGRNTSPMTAHYLATVRAAELAAKHQCESFSILGSQSDVKQLHTAYGGHQFTNTRSTASVTGNAYHYGNHSTFNANAYGNTNTTTLNTPTTFTTVNKPETSIFVQVYRDPRQGAYNTREVLSVANSKKGYRLAATTRAYLGTSRR